jgi:AICAR transformylase/IMP cyclohydrolase PurH
LLPELQTAGEPADFARAPLPVRCAIIAPYDKTGAADLARGLIDRGAEVYSTSGSHKHLTVAGYS